MPTYGAGVWDRLASPPGLQVAVWCALVLLSVGLIVLARTRWHHQRPLEKCAVLSLIVHLLFACLAMMVRVVTGPGSGMGEGPPIRVRIVSESTPSDVALHETPPHVAAPSLLEVPQEEPPAETPLPDPTPVAELTQAEPPEEPPLTASTDQAEPEPTPPELIDPAAELAANLPDALPDLVPEPVPASDPAPQAAPAAAEPPPQSVATDIAPVGDGAVADAPPKAVLVPHATPAVRDEAYALRTDADRLGLVESQGGSRRTEAAVAAALKWLAAAQSADGRWDASRYGAGHETRVYDQSRGGAGANADTGISALALLAFLGSGYTHQSGEYRRTIDSALDFLQRSQGDDGNLFGEAEFYAQMYCHSMSTFALAEALAMTGDRNLEPGVRLAISFSLRAQHPSAGGWRYRAGDIGDTSQLGWQVMALASAERAGLDIPPPTWTGVERFLRSVRRGQRGGLASYRPDGPPSTSMTAEAFYCRELVAQVSRSAVDEHAAKEATAQILASLPDPELVNLYYWYYATLALHHRHPVSDEARAAWRQWNDALVRVLLDSQVASGSDTGSWEPNCLWGGYGGRVYTTALAALCLEVYYRYAPPPASQVPWMATQPTRLE